MKYENRKRFKYALGLLMNKSRITSGPLRERFISLSWKKYKSQDKSVKLFANPMEKNSFNSILKKMNENKTWGSYIYLMTDGNVFL